MRSGNLQYNFCRIRSIFTTLKVDADRLQSDNLPKKEISRNMTILLKTDITTNLFCKRSNVSGKIQRKLQIVV